MKSEQKRIFVETHDTMIRIHAVVEGQGFRMVFKIEDIIKLIADLAKATSDASTNLKKYKTP